MNMPKSWRFSDVYHKKKPQSQNRNKKNNWKLTIKWQLNTIAVVFSLNCLIIASGVLSKISVLPRGHFSFPILLQQMPALTMADVRSIMMTDQKQRKREKTAITQPLTRRKFQLRQIRKNCSACLWEHKIEMKINIKLGGLAKIKNRNEKLTDSIIISFVAKLWVSEWLLACEWSGVNMGE
jgi:hypothetical protein